MINQINAEVETLTEYGYREVTATRPSWLAVWLKGAYKWKLVRTVKKNQVVRLNQCEVLFPCNKFVARLYTEKVHMPPLYHYLPPLKEEDYD